MWNKSASRARRGRGLRARAALVLACGAVAGSAGGADVTSTFKTGVGSPGLWSDLKYWKNTPAVAVVPNNGNGGYTFDVDLTGALMALDMDVTVDRFTGGLGNTSGQRRTLTATSGMVLGGAYYGLALDAGPATTFAAGATFELSDTILNLSGDLAAAGNVTLTLISGGVLNVGAGTTFTPGSATTNSFRVNDNAGTGVNVAGTLDTVANTSISTPVNVLAGGTLRLGTAQLWNRLTSAGTIEVAAGKLLSVTNGSSTPNVISGPVVLNAGSRLSFSGSASTTVTLSGGVSFAGTGTLMNSGVLNVDAALTMPGGIDVSGSVTTGTAVNVNQPVTVSGASIVNGTTIKGPAVATFADLTLVSANVKARVAVAEGGRLMLGHSGYSSTTNTLYGAVIDVAGTLGAPGSVTRTLDGTLSTVNVLSTGTFAPGTTLQLRTPTAGQGVANTIDNRGLISLDGKRLELYSGWNLTNAGTIRVRNGGALLMLGSSDYGYSGAGIVDVDGAGSGASLTQVAGATFSGTYTIGAGSSISFFGGRFAPATLTNAGTIYLRSAVDTAMTIPGNVSTNGTTTVDAPLTIGGKLALGPDTFTATALTGTGSVTTPNLSTRATTIDVDVDVTDGSATTFQSTVNLTDATIRLAGGRTIAGTSFRAPVGATGRVEVKSGATVTLPAAGRATLGPGVGLAATGTGTLANAGTLDVDAGRLTVTAGWALENAGTVRARNGGMVFVTSGGGIANSGKIDLSTGGLAVLTGGGAGTSTEAVRAQLVAGRNDGTWDGATGIVSADAAATGGAQAVGYALAGELLRIGGAETAVWNGVTVDAGAVLVRHTLLGDADLNGTVGLNDLVVLANHYGAAGGWAQGDFDYNGEIALNDLVVLANQYGSSVTSPVAAGDFAADWALAQELAAGGATGVPEPGAVGLAGLGGAAMFGRRPRRRR